MIKPIDLLLSLKGKAGRYCFALFAPLIALGLVALVQKTGWMQRLENLTIAFRFQVREPWDPPADPRLLLVGIDQQSLDYLGKWPWPRTVEADFLKAIDASGMNPRTVAFDLMFTDAYDPYHDFGAQGQPNMDELLGNAAGLLPSVITGAKISVPTGVPADDAKAAQDTEAALHQAVMTLPIGNIVGDPTQIRSSTIANLPVEPLRRQSLFGFINDDPSAIDGIRYTVPMVMRVGGTAYPSFSLQVLCQVLHVDADHVTVKVGDQIILRNSSNKTWSIPINARGEMAINYRSAKGFSVVSFKGLFEYLVKHLKFNEAIPTEADIDKKAVVVAAVAEGSTDLGSTPMDVNSPLVYTHLNAINNVLRSDYIRSVPWPWLAFGWLAITWLSLFGLHLRPIAWVVGVPTAIIFFYTFFAFAVFWIWSLEIALAWPVLAYFGVQFTYGVLRWVAEARDRLQLRAVFSRMVSPQVMEHVLSNPAGLQLGGTTRAVTILFSDIRDFTKISEHIGNEELVRQLNTYFGEMVECVTEHGGTFHKFIGDAIMAVWGDISTVSSSPAEEARCAVRAALEMRRRLAKLNETRTAEGWLPLRIGIGLNFGEVLVGQIGAARRSEFTVIGDPVNAASRLEGMTKEFGIDLAIGESVEVLLNGKFLTRPVGRVQLKGKSKPMLVFEVLEERDHAASVPWREEDLQIYRDAFDRFLARDFPAAEEGFSACALRHPDDHCVKRYWAAARQYRVVAPPEDWDGRVIMETK